MFLRRLFYDLTTGAMLRMLTLSGAAIAPTLETDAEGLTNWGVVEWNEPDAETEAAFAEVDEDGKARTVSVTVDLSDSEPQLSFTYAPVEDPTERDDPYAIIDILTGEG